MINIKANLNLPTMNLEQLQEQIVLGHFIPLRGTFEANLYLLNQPITLVNFSEIRAMQRPDFMLQPLTWRGIIGAMESRSPDDFASQDVSHDFDAVIYIHKTSASRAISKAS